MNHIYILILIIVLVGAIAGLTNYLDYFYKGLINNIYEFIKYILRGIGAAILVPLFLNMLSSSLIEYSEGYNYINYFVFAGFCYIAGYFSDRFISTVGERVLKDLEKANKRIKVAMTSSKQNEEKLDLLVSAESEFDEELVTTTELDLSKFKENMKFADDDIEYQVNNVFLSFLGKYKLRTVKGIAKELNYSLTVVESILKVLFNQGFVKSFTDKNGKTLWTTTNQGKLFAEELNKNNHNNKNKIE
ncbi:hypothetical protein E0494_01740 [Marinilabiliaceae bacterium JC040]|nr:hypothetical protein [Marinilabiliaceae bacterium JC040]